MLVEKIVRSLAFRVDTKSICVHSDEPDEQARARHTVHNRWLGCVASEEKISIVHVTWGN